MAAVSSRDCCAGSCRSSAVTRFGKARFEGDISASTMRLTICLNYFRCIVSGLHPELLPTRKPEVGNRARRGQRGTNSQLACRRRTSSTDGWVQLWHERGLSRHRRKKQGARAGGTARQFQQRHGMAEPAAQSALSAAMPVGKSIIARSTMVPREGARYGFCCCLS
jgi:hypothetical protein